MALRYRNPPLVEAICEVRFASAPGRKWTEDGEMLHEQIRDRFPVRGTEHEMDLPIVTPVALGSTSPSLARLQFVSEDGNTMVQVGPDVLAVNSLRAHVGWPELRDTLLQVLTDYRAIAAPLGLTSATVRYINRVEIPLERELSLDKYFSVLPGLPQGVPAAVSTFLLHTEVGYEDPTATFTFRFATTESTGEVAAFMLDYEHFAPGPAVPELDALAAWLDTGHDRIERAFYGSFTPMTHAEIFGEISS